MKINNEDLQRLYRAYVEEKIPLSRKNCPTTKDIIVFFKAKSSEKHKTKIVDHITQCSWCIQEFEFILKTLRYKQILSKQIGNLLISEKNISIVKRKSDRTLFHSRKRQFPFFLRLSWTYALLFFGALIAIFSFIFLLDKFQFQHLRKQEDRGKKIIPINLIEPINRTYAKSQLVFKWNELKELDYYVLELFDETLIPIWKSPKIFKNQFVLPNEVTKELIKNKAYFWMVTASFRDGRLIESGVEKFYLTD